MSRVMILDCTLRDGGYINNWQFGKETIVDIIQKLSIAGIEFIEVGFIKDIDYESDCAIFPDTATVEGLISTKTPGVIYVGMIDMNDPIPIEAIDSYNGKSVDAIRVIFKKNNIEKGYHYVKELMKLGYLTMVQLVSTNDYSDRELIDVLEKFNALDPYAVYIVDSLGVMDKADFLRMIYIADNHLDKKVILGYHSHNNMQQAKGNSEAFVELGLTRDIIVDASVFGMGRGSGNLNMELFAGYLNRHHGKNYRIEPLLEIYDEHLHEIYVSNFWGYSLHFYLSASNSCHPNYAKYYSEKGTLTVKAFNELLKTIPEGKKSSYSKIDAENFYAEYMKKYIDDKEALKKLHKTFKHKDVLIIAPGKTHIKNHAEISKLIAEKSPIVVSAGFSETGYDADYIFYSNMRRYSRASDSTIDRIITSNVLQDSDDAIIVNYSSYISDNPTIVDNTAIMLMNLLLSLEVNEIYLAGMDGYEESSSIISVDIYGREPSYASMMNEAISKELSKLNRHLKITFVTPTLYNLQA